MRRLILALTVVLVMGFAPGCDPANTCANATPTITGTEGDDTGINALIGTEGADVIFGLGGNDVIQGLGGPTSSAADRATMTDAGSWRFRMRTPDR